MLVQFKDVNKKYSGKVALHNVSFEIPTGRVIGLLGPNGSGKSTIIKLMNGLIQPNAGSILIEGNKVGVQSHLDIAYLPERTYLNDWMRVRQLIEFFSDFYSNFDATIAAKLFKDLGIDLEDRLVAMSKGTKEKVQLVLVMARKAKLYILDEPIGGVDPAGRDYILNTIIKNYDTDSTLIIATHLIQEVESICDDVIFIHNGVIKLQGNVDDLRAEHGKSVDQIFREVFKCY
ncbi:MAG: ABC transporter [Epulopiscium sp. Nele67-Bin002]|nr:MAG: ABC transporter [Epulopiscium sp. Nuni2H_MBin001]OON90808.1 MAG: ABC transporter [Epulopiscium sp. Nele67-Bin001]OON91784.1 MAG: ABC transporter [Epulopiscium sp. Nele67-Bin002]